MIAGYNDSWGNLAFIRLGTKLAHDTAGVSFGGGLKMRGIMVDYAYVNFGILSQTHQFGISLDF